MTSTMARIHNISNSANKDPDRSNSNKTPDSGDPDSSTDKPSEEEAEEEEADEEEGEEEEEEEMEEEAEEEEVVHKRRRKKKSKLAVVAPKVYQPYFWDIGRIASDRKLSKLPEECDLTRQKIKYLKSMLWDHKENFNLFVRRQSDQQSARKKTLPAINTIAHTPNKGPWTDELQYQEGGKGSFMVNKRHSAVPTRKGMVGRESLGVGLSEVDESADADSLSRRESLINDILGGQGASAVHLLPSDAVQAPRRASRRGSKKDTSSTGTTSDVSSGQTAELSKTSKNAKRMQSAQTKTPWEKSRPFHKKRSTWEEEQITESRDGFITNNRTVKQDEDSDLAKTYIQEYGIQDVFQTLMVDLLTHRPKDPLGYMIALMHETNKRRLMAQTVSQITYCFSYTPAQGKRDAILRDLCAVMAEGGCDPNLFKPKVDINRVAKHFAQAENEPSPVTSEDSIEPIEPVKVGSATSAPRGRRSTLSTGKTGGGRGSQKRFSTAQRGNKPKSPSSSRSGRGSVSPTPKSLSRDSSSSLRKSNTSLHNALEKDNNDSAENDEPNRPRQATPDTPMQASRTDSAPDSSAS